MIFFSFDLLIITGHFIVHFLSEFGPYQRHAGSSVQISKKGNYENFGNFVTDISESSVISKNSVISEISKIFVISFFGNLNIHTSSTQNLSTFTRY